MLVVKYTILIIRRLSEQRNDEKGRDISNTSWNRKRFFDCFGEFAKTIEKSFFLDYKNRFTLMKPKEKFGVYLYFVIR
jgi:hypothetical protein